MKCFLNYSLLDPLIIDMHRWSRSVLLWRWSLWCVYCKRYSHQCNDNGSDNGALVDIIIISRSGWNTFSSCCRHWICTIQGKWDKNTRKVTVFLAFCELDKRPADFVRNWWSPQKMVITLYAQVGKYRLRIIQNHFGSRGFIQIPRSSKIPDFGYNLNFVLTEYNFG